MTKLANPLCAYQNVVRERERQTSASSFSGSAQSGSRLAIDNVRSRRLPQVGAEARSRDLWGIIFQATLSGLARNPLCELIFGQTMKEEPGQ